MWAYTNEDKDDVQPTPRLPEAKLRHEFWYKGYFNASWYCIECYCHDWNFTRDEALHILGHKQRTERKEECKKQAAQKEESTRQPTKKSRFVKI